MAGADKTNKKRDRLKYMILSVLIAIAAWFAVMYTANPDITKKFTGIRVELTGTDILRGDGLVAVGEAELPKISVKLRGKRSDLMKAVDNIRIYADVSGISGEGEYFVETSVKLPSASLSVVDVSCSAVEVSVEEYKSKEIKLEVYRTGNLDGKVVEIVPLSETVTAMGAASELEKIGGASVTVDISSLGTGGTGEYKTELFGKDGVLEEEIRTVSLKKDSVRIESIVYNAKEIPVKIISAGMGEYEIDYEKTVIEPQKITVGVSENDETEYAAVTIPEKFEGEAEYDVYCNEGVYIPDESKKIRVIPAWKKIL